MRGIVGNGTSKKANGQRSSYVFQCANIYERENSPTHTFEVLRLMSFDTGSDHPKLCLGHGGCEHPRLGQTPTGGAFRNPGGWYGGTVT
eukprot:1663764-Amphidinium_carterae.1